MKTKKEEAYLTIILVTFSILIWNWNINQLENLDFTYRISSANASVNLQDEGTSSISGEAESLDGVTVEGEQSPYETVEDKIRAAFPEDPETAVAIAKAESNLQSWRVGDKHLVWRDGRNGMSCGIFQIRVFPNRPDCEQLFDEDFNIEYARQLYESSGWYPWSTYKSDQYKEHLS
jgi:hypothetical protein